MEEKIVTVLNEMAAYLSIAVDGGNYDTEGKIFPQIIEKLGLGFKICNSSIRICRDDVDEIRRNMYSLY